MSTSDLPSFESIFNEYKCRVFGLIMRMIHNHEDAEDLTQQVFIRVYKKFGAFRRESDIYTWIYRIAMNLCADYIRRRMHRRKHGETLSLDESLDESHPPLSETISETVPSHEKRLEQLELTTIVREIISHMKEKYRDVIILREFEGLSYKEIAMLLKISVKTVEIRLIRARNQLKQGLKKIL